MEASEMWEPETTESEDPQSRLSLSPVSSKSLGSIPTSPFIGDDPKDSRFCRVSPNKSHDSGYSDSEEGGKFFLEDALYDVSDVEGLKRNLRQLETDYILFERERYNIFEDQRGSSRRSSQRSSIRELFRSELNSRMLSEDEEDNLCSIETVLEAETFQQASDASYVTQVYVSNGDNTSIVRQADNTRKTITVIKDDSCGDEDPENTEADRLPASHVSISLSTSIRVVDDDIPPITRPPTLKSNCAETVSPPPPPPPPPSSQSGLPHAEVKSEEVQGYSVSSTRLLRTRPTSPVKLARSSLLRAAKSEIALTPTELTPPENLSKSADELEKTLERVEFPVSPVRLWLNQLQSFSESECNNILQSKTLANCTSSIITMRALRRVQNQGRSLARLFSKLCRDLRSDVRRDLVGTIKTLDSGIHSLVSRFNRWSYSNPAGVKSIVARGDNVLYLHKRANNILHNIKISVSRVTSRNLEEVVDLLREFGTVFSDLIETLLSEIVRESIQTLGKSKTETALKDSLLLVSKLGLEGNHICRLFAREGGVEVLLRILGESASSNHRGLILRTLGTLCSVKESIKEFESLDGLEVLAGVLRDEQEERILMEAAGVLAQITSPWIENSLDAGKVEEHAYDIVSSLTKLSSFTKSSETFLLCTAALANLSYLSPLLLTAMSQLETVPPLLSFIYHRVSPSIYILDQIATILANLSASHHTRDSLRDCDVVPSLLLLLAADPSNSDRSRALLAATQRVQQKAAIAIGRLAVYPSVCQGILSGGGLERLVELSVCREARIDSDYTLVSVVTAVRKISQVVDILPDIRRLGAQDILDSNIINSIQVFSPMQESFV